MVLNLETLNCANKAYIAQALETLYGPHAGMVRQVSVLNRSRIPHAGSGGRRVAPAQGFP